MQCLAMYCGPPNESQWLVADKYKFNMRCAFVWWFHGWINFILITFCCIVLDIDINEVWPM